jgi:hypothetical protein
VRLRISFRTSDGTRPSINSRAIVTDFIDSNAGAVVLKIAYGWTVTSNEDQLVNFMKDAARIGAEIVQPGKWHVEIVPLLRFVPAWVPGAEFKRKAAYARQCLTGIDIFPFNWTKEQIVRHNLVIDSAHFITDFVSPSPRNLEITLSRSPPWVLILKVANHLVQKKTLSDGVVLPCTEVAPIL